MASLSLTTAALNFKSVAEKYFCGSPAEWMLPAELQCFPSPFSCTGVQCLWSRSPRDMVNVKCTSATTNSFFLPKTHAFLLSVESSTSICLCPACYIHTWSSSSMWAPILRSIGLQDQCAWILLLLFLVCSFFLTSYLSLFQRPLTPDDEWTR